MQLTLAILALASAAVVAAQGNTKSAGSPPPGCLSDFNGKFQITVALPSRKRSIVESEPACPGTGTLVAALNGSVLTDSFGRIGSIVANDQFQFDGPPQDNAIYTSGFSVCSNGSLALGPSAIFYQCLSGNFYNIYDSPVASECEAVVIEVIPCGVGGGAGQAGDGQPTGPSATQVATQVPDGQIQASSAGPKVTQIGDGQVQASSAPPKPVSQFTDGQIQITGPVGPAMSVAPASSTNVPAGQIGDGQVQASATLTSAASSGALAPISQAPDGQPQATVVGSVTTKAIPAAPTTAGAAVVQVGAQFGLAIAALVAILML